jgi:hypothetical protein
VGRQTTCLLNTRGWGFLPGKLRQRGDDATGNGY